MTFAASFLEQLQPVSALVVGDLMLDRYVVGDIGRISPEAPVMILEASEVQDRPGGAAAVANYLRTFGAGVALAGAVGRDEAGDVLLQILSELSVNCEGVIRDVSRNTTLKQRFLGSHPQRQPRQVLRVDQETRRPLSAQHCDDIIQRIEDAAPSTDVISLVDYAKGVCSEGFVQSVIAAAREHAIPVLADPGRGVAPERYRGAFLLKPNRIEAGEMTGTAINSVDQAHEAAAQIMNMTDVENVVITLDCDGSVVATRDGLVLHVYLARAVMRCSRIRENSEAGHVSARSLTTPATRRRPHSNPRGV